MKLRTVVLLAALLALPASGAIAQSGPVITTVVFKAHAPQAFAANAAAGSGVISSGCAGFPIGNDQIDRTCSGAKMPIGARISPSNIVFASINGARTMFYYYNSRPPQGCGTITMNIFAGTSQTPLWSGCAASRNFTLTINANGTMGLAQQ